MGAEYPYDKKFKKKGLSQSYREEIVREKYIFPTQETPRKNRRKV
jgi:hypothetical protein